MSRQDDIDHSAELQRDRALAEKEKSSLRPKLMRLARAGHVQAKLSFHFGRDAQTERP